MGHCGLNRLKGDKWSADQTDDVLTADKILDDLVALTLRDDERVAHPTSDEDVLAKPTVELFIVAQRLDDVILCIPGSVLFVAKSNQILDSVWNAVGLPYLYSMWLSRGAV